jgi:CubicO group peptidase (beta-lactamase class C family)
VARARGAHGKVSLFLWFWLVLTVGACDRPGPAQELPSQTPAVLGDLPESSPEEQGLNPELLAEAYREAREIEPLLSLLVARNGYLVSEEYFHDTDRTTAFDVKSVSKSFLSGITGVAIEAGFLKGIDQPVSDILPEYFEGDDGVGHADLPRRYAASG